MVFTRKTRLITLVALIGAGIAIGVMVATNPQKTLFVIAAGVLGSWIAGLFVLVMNAIVLGDPAEQALKAMGALQGGLRRLDNANSLLRSSAAYGIHDVRPKVHFSPADWGKVLAEANEELTIVGHALDKWCADGMRSELIETIKRVVSSGGRVRLLSLSPSNARVPGQRKKEYERRIKRSLATFAQIEAMLSEDHNGSFEVHHLNDDADMHYLAVVTDKVVITAPYPAAEQRSDSVPTVKVDASSGIADLIRGDLDQMFLHHAQPVTLASYR